MNNRDFLLYQGDCIAVMRTMATASVDSIVTDPPYELGFMGKGWDSTGIANSVEMWTEALRVLKPGGHLLAFSGSRTYHRMVCAIEDAGFEIRDQIMWVYGSGFPKSLDVSKAIDKARGDDATEVTRFLASKRGDVGLTEIARALGFAATNGTHGTAAFFSAEPRLARVPTPAQWEILKGLLGLSDEMDAEVARLNARKGMSSDEYASRPDAEYSTGVGMREGWTDGSGWNGKSSKGGDPVREAARQWQGWGTALKPAHEPICVARKPLAKGHTIAANVMAHGTGALNIDACRVGDGDDRTAGGATGKRVSADEGYMGAWSDAENGRERPTGGRWPANLIHDGSVEVLAEFPDLGNAGKHIGHRRDATADMGGYSGAWLKDVRDTGYADAGSAARFFYTAKADGEDRNEGIQGSAKAHGRNLHPTVKPTDLMRYLCRLVTPAGGLVLDPFMGSGSTGKAAVLEGFCFVGIDLSPEYVAIARVRIDAAVRMGYQPSLNLEAA